MPLRDPMRWARAEAVRLARQQGMRFCVLHDYRVVPLMMRPRDQEVRGVAYPMDDFRFVYCELQERCTSKNAPIETSHESTVGARSMPELA